MSRSTITTAMPQQVAAAFAQGRACHPARARNNRIVVNAMEPRAAIAEYDQASGRFTLHVRVPGRVRHARQHCRICSRSSRKQVRILTDQVGGSFGMKAAPFPEYVCVLHAARELGRPVKWTDERSGSFVSDSHGRDHEMTAELALDADGNFLAVRARPASAISARPLAGRADARRRATRCKNMLSVYRTPLIEVSTKCVFTNTTHGRRLSRRRAARGQLLHGAAGRRRRAPRWASTASSCAGATRSGREEMPYKARDGTHL